MLLTPKQIEIIAVIVLILSGWIFGWWQLHELHAYQDNQAEQIKKNIELKTTEDSQHAQDTIDIASSYSTQLDILNKRLQNLQAVPRVGGLRVASGIGNSGTVFQKTDSTSGLDASTTLAQRPTIRDGFYSDALEDTVQLEQLQDYVRKICM